MGKFKIPFEPPWDDLKREAVSENGTKCYIFDSCVVREPDERAAIDRGIVEIIVRSDRRRFLGRLEK